MQLTPSLQGAKALVKQAPQTQQGRPWRSASKPQGGLANKLDTGVCVNSTSGGGRSLATPVYQDRLALIFLPLGAAVTKIRSATLTLPSTQGRLFTHLHPTFPRRNCSTNTQSRAKFQSLPLSLTSAGPAGPCAGRIRPLSVAESRSIG